MRQNNYYMQREIQKYLLDIKVSIDSIIDYLGDKSDFTEYTANKLLRRGIERERGADNFMPFLFIRIIGWGY